MSTAHPALEWLSRRRDGESAALIASHAGVPEAAVLRATNPYGPFPRPSRQLGRTYTPGAVLDERAARWVAQRRRGVMAADIARGEGVAHQVVSRVTKGHGPFPAVDVVEAWVEARHRGRTVPAIAAEDGVRPGVVRAATAAHGPFRTPGARLPDGVESMSSIARRMGVEPVTVLQWRRKGKLPEPDFVTARGRPVWLPATIDRWLEHADLETCPDCGARCLSASRHRTLAHRGRSPGVAPRPYGDAMTEPGWMYRTHFWPEGEGQTIEQWRQSLLDDGWEIWAPGAGCWAVANQRRRFGVSLRRRVENPWATPPR